MAKLRGICLIIILAVFLSAFTIPEKNDDEYIVDLAGIIQDDTKNTIITRNTELAQLGGARVLILTIDSAGGDIQKYTESVYRGWELDTLENKDALLLVVAVNDEDYCALQDQGLSGVFDNSDINQMLNQYFEPSFAAAEFDRGVFWFANAIFNELELYYAPIAQLPNAQEGSGEQNYEHDGGFFIYALFSFAVLAGIIGAVMLFRKNGNGGSYRQRDIR